jgi:hypothetical protein
VRGFFNPMIPRMLSVALLTMLVVVPAVEAACAWVLWEHRVQLGAKRGAIEEWSILDAYDSRTACREVHTKLMSGETAWSTYLMGYMPTPPTPEEKSKWTPTMRELMESHESEGRTERLKLERTPIEGGFIVISYDKDGERIVSETKTAQCLPDTIDPRGPKGTK